MTKFIYKCVLMSSCEVTESAALNSLLQSYYFITRSVDLYLALTDKNNYENNKRI